MPSDLHSRRPAGSASSQHRNASDVALMVAVERRDHAALAELHRRHAGSLFCNARRVLSTPALAEDVVQDVFIRLWHSSERFDPSRGSLRAFLLAQGHHRAIDIIRSESARRRREEGEATKVAQPYVMEDEVMDAVVGQRVRDAVKTLGDKEREAISLAYFGGHSYVDVASMLGVPEGTIKSRIRSGLARLRTAVVEAGVDPLLANSSRSG